MVAVGVDGAAAVMRVELLEAIANVGREKVGAKHRLSAADGPPSVGGEPWVKGRPMGEERVALAAGTRRAGS